MNPTVFLTAHKRPLLLLLAVILLLASTPDAYAQQPDSAAQASEEAADDRFLVGVTAGAPREEVAAVLAAEGLVLGRYWPRFGVAEALMPVTAASASAFLAARGDDLAARSELVRYVEPDGRVYAADIAVEPPHDEPVPNDPRFNEQWALHKIEAVKAWNITHGDPDIVIAVIDSGYTPFHPDFSPINLWVNQAEANGLPGVDDDGNGYVDDIHGWDWVGRGFLDDPGDNTPEDPHGHGTHVLGTIAATTGNGVGVSGAGRAVRVAPLRILDAFGGGFESDLIDALDYATMMRMSVINLSLTGGPSFALHNAIQVSNAAGLIIVAATGNYSSSVLWPAAYPETVAVAATDAMDQRASFSNFGPQVTVAAPGVDVLSLYHDLPFRPFHSMSGTSMATPHVSALLGLLRSLRPDLSTNDLVALMTATAVDANAASFPGSDIYLGAGRIDMYAALLAASSGLTLSATPAGFDPVVTGDPLELGIQVAASGLTVQGAVVYLQILAAPGLTAVAAAQRALTDASGNVSFPFSAPKQPGDYILRVQVGAALIDLPIQAVDPFDIHVDIHQPELMVGGENTPFTVTVRSKEGELLAEPQTMYLETSLGQINGQRTLETVVEGGVFTGTLRSGNIAGTATVSATISVSTGVAQVVFLPGPPSTLAFNEAPDRIVTDRSNTIFTLSVRVTDAYGNPVDPAEGVAFSASAGAISPPQAATNSGAVTVTIGIPRAHLQPVVVKAVVPGNEDLRDEIELVGVPPHIWLPFAFVE